MAGIPGRTQNPGWKWARLKPAIWLDVDKWMGKLLKKKERKKGLLNLN